MPPKPLPFETLHEGSTIRFLESVYATAQTSVAIRGRLRTPSRLSHAGAGEYLLPGREIIFILYNMEVGQESGSSKRMGGYIVRVGLLHPGQCIWPMAMHASTITDHVTADYSAMRSFGDHGQYDGEGRSSSYGRASIPWHAYALSRVARRRQCRAGGQCAFVRDCRQGGHEKQNMKYTPSISKILDILNQGSIFRKSDVVAIRDAKLTRLPLAVCTSSAAALTLAYSCIKGTCLSLLASIRKNNHLSWTSSLSKDQP